MRSQPIVVFAIAAVLAALAVGLGYGVAQAEPASAVARLGLEREGPPPAEVAPADGPARQVVRKGSVIKVKPEMLDVYKELHAECWPEVLQMIRECNIRNYTIFYRDGYLFSYLEYIGTDWDADMAKMAADPITQKWWELTDPCQEPVETAEPGEWWAPMEEVFHTD